MQESDVPEFQVGLALAGAISAGAYSAGVFDFLSQALDAWEKAKADTSKSDETPNHRVGVKVIGGASAGAITGALGAAAMAGGLKPEPLAPTRVGYQKWKYVFPNLYDAWVVRPNMISPDGRADFLQTDDLDTSQKVISALNSQVLLDISRTSFLPSIS